MKIITNTILASALCACLASNANAQSWLTNGLVAYYPFSGNANDASGNGNNGTINGPTFMMDRFGYTNSALFFDTNSVSSAFFPPLGTSSRSISVWFNVAACPQQMTFVCYGGDTYWGTRFELKIMENGNLALDVGGAGVTTTSNYKDGKWHQFTVVAPTNASLSDVILYIDGVQQTDLSYYNDPPINTSGTFTLLMGQLFLSGDSRYLIGSLDDIRIFNRNLSSDEVAQLYQIESAQIVNLNKAVWLSFSNLRNGTNYQVQVSADLNGTFTNYGSPFTATNATMNYPAYWNVGDWNQLFFRLQALP